MDVCALDSIGLHTTLFSVCIASFFGRIRGGNQRIKQASPNASGNGTAIKQGAPVVISRCFNVFTGFTIKTNFGTMVLGFFPDQRRGVDLVADRIP
jgi:hypothetical protein